jgi:hypothetical protein
MGTFQRRERALTDLLGGSLSADDYPESLTLPPYIHDRTQQAVAGAAEDGRERSIRFLYRRGRWTGGLAIKGTAPSIDKIGNWRAEASRLDAAANVFYRPHIGMHTHPDPMPAIIQESVRIVAASKGWSEEERLKQEEVRLARLKEIYPLPSWLDIKEWSIWSHASIGNLVASTGGNFLMLLRKGQPDTHVLLECLTDVPYDIPKRGKDIYQAICGAVPEKPAESYRSLALAGITKTVGDRFVSYFSDDPESPHLPRTA